MNARCQCAADSAPAEDVVYVAVVGVAAGVGVLSVAILIIARLDGAEDWMPKTEFEH